MCFGCGAHNDGSVVACHANWQEMGKSAGSKAHDFAAAYCCAGCHAELDQGKNMSREDRKAFWMRAFWATQQWLWESGYLIVSTVPTPPPPQVARPKKTIPKGPKLKGRGFEKPAVKVKIPSRPWGKRREQ